MLTFRIVKHFQDHSIIIVFLFLLFLWARIEEHNRLQLWVNHQLPTINSYIRHQYYQCDLSKFF